MQLKKATRKQLKLKIGLFGTSGSGKTYSALLMAYGITGDWNKIAIIDTENESASYYSNLGDFNVLSLQAPYSPERYVEAINACIDGGMEAIIIDSMSHEWDWPGGCLEIHGAMPGNSFMNWWVVGKRHKAMLDKILLSQTHFILCGRRKQEYQIVEKNGKQVPEKMGLSIIQRDGLDYELGVSFDININHQATASKDRTWLFTGKPDFIITEDTGKQLITWADSGEGQEELAMEEPTKQDTTQAFDIANEEAGTAHLAEKTIKTWNKLLETSLEDLDKQAQSIKLQLAKAPFGEEDKNKFFKFVDTTVLFIKNK